MFLSVFGVLECFCVFLRVLCVFGCFCEFLSVLGVLSVLVVFGCYVCFRVLESFGECFGFWRVLLSV